jgi:hypothetical protein
LKISQIGSNYIGTIEKSIYLKYSSCAPSITKNLLSISQLIKDNDVIIEFTSSSCFMKDQITHQVLLRGTMLNELYQLDLVIPQHQVLKVDHLSASLWHIRLIHYSPIIITALNNQNKISTTNSKVFFSFVVKPKHISYPLLSQLLWLLHHYNLCILTYGTLPPLFFHMVTNTM